MAKTRMINTRFWSDSYVLELTPLEKLLFIYFISNERTTIAGVYELPLRLMVAETGIEESVIKSVLERFKNDGKIYHIDNWIYVKNFQKHQTTSSENVKKGIKSEMSKVPLKIREMIGSIEGIKTVSGPIIYLDLDLNPDLNTDLDFSGDGFPEGEVQIPEGYEMPHKKPVGFDYLRKYYPRKERIALAESEYNALNPDESLRGKMQVGLQQHLRSVQFQKENGRFVPLLANWIAEKRWEEVLPETKKTYSAADAKL